MKLRICSDLHTEFLNSTEIQTFGAVALPPLPDDKNTTLILAGDIGSMQHPENIASFMAEVAPRFKEIFYIPGNHESYGGDLKTTRGIITEMLAGYDNVFFTPSGGAVRDGAEIHLHTLWTDFDDSDPLAMREAGEGMNDYRLIRNGEYILSPKVTLDIHRSTVEVLEGCVREGDIVVTHHMPSFQSVPAAYKDRGRINGAYASNLESFILERKPKLWMHGHTHDACDYMIGDTRILCNPRGYGKQHTHNGYNPTLIVEA